MKLIKSITALCLMSSLLPTTTMATPVAELEQRIRVLEEAAQERAASVEELEARSERQMHVAGYADVEYITSTRPDTPDTFRMHHMSLFFERPLAERWRFFSEIEFEDAPIVEGDADTLDKARGKIFVEAVHLTYHWREQASLRVGRFFTPAGIWLIDHYPPFVPTQERPRHIRKIFPQIVDGMQAFGSLALGEAAFVNYDAYVGNGRGNTASDANSSKAGGLRASVILPWLDLFEVGASYYADPRDAARGDVAYAARGLHTRLRWRDTQLQAEAARGEGGGDRGEGFYLQLLHELGPYGLGLRHDVYDPDADGSESSPQRVTTESVFTNYHFNRNVVLKLELHHVVPDDPVSAEYNKTILSVVGYLGD